jgi:hypothetical protein
MNEAELIGFLKQHLKIELDSYYDSWNENNKLKVSLKIDDVIIAEDTITLKQLSE